MNFKDLTHPKQKGEATEAIITAEFMRRGILVCKPIGDNLPFDLLIYKKSSNELFKIQCRTACTSENEGALHFKFVSSRINTKNIYEIDNRKFIDFFAAFSPDTNKVYIIKSTETSVKQISLRYKESKNNQQSGTNKAQDYELDFHLDKFI